MPRSLRFRVVWMSATLGATRAHLETFLTVGKTREARESFARLFRRDVIGWIGLRLDALLDLAQRIEAGLNGLIRQVMQDVDRNRIAQAVEIVDELPAALREEQAVGAAVFRIMPALEQSMFDQTIEQPH